MSRLLDVLPPALAASIAEGARVGRYVVDGLPVCRRGHVKDPANVYWHRGVSRCRKCRREYRVGFGQGLRRPFRPKRCKRGHEFGAANTMWIDGGTRRECRTCTNARARKRYWLERSGR